MPSAPDQFWYRAELIKKHGGTTSHTIKTGTLEAHGALTALDRVYEMYNGDLKGDWKVDSAWICEVDKDGEVVATHEAGPADKTHTCEKDEGTLLYKWSTVVNHGKFPAGFKEESK